MSALRLALLCDYAEENWPSMDLYAEMLLEHFDSSDIHATRVQPSFRHLFTRNADRLLNRLLAYPLEARRISGCFDLFHLVDHSYSQLVHVMPARRTVVTCHDADTFRCLVSPREEPRPRWFRAMVSHILRGLRKAACVVCVSEATRSQLIRHGLVDPARIRVIHNGVHPAFTNQPDQCFDQEAARLLGPATGPELLHVGSTISRKRIDLLLHIFAECRARDRTLRLIRVGAPFSPEQQRLASRLAAAEHITHLEKIPPKLLAAIYRRAAIVLLTSEAEGFGLPLAEAMACGTPVAVSDIPSLREVGGGAAAFYPVGDITQWSAGLRGLLEERASNLDSFSQRTTLCLNQASLFAWDRNAGELARVYRTVLNQT